MMKLAVAIDGSDNALRAAHYAIDVATLILGASVEVIYVADYTKTKDEYLLAESVESLALKREQKFHKVVDYANEQQVNVKTRLLKGNPSDEIIRYAKDENIDQLFIGNRGLNAFQEMLVGSVSQKVLKYANCPVTLVK